MIFNKFNTNEIDLPEKAHLVISKMNKNQKWQMCIPPQDDDSDMVLSRIIEGYNKYKAAYEILKKANDKCTKYGEGTPGDRHKSSWDCLEELQVEFKERNLLLSEASKKTEDILK